MFLSLTVSDCPVSSQGITVIYENIKGSLRNFLSHFFSHLSLAFFSLSFTFFSHLFIRTSYLALHENEYLNFHLFEWREWVKERKNLYTWMEDKELKSLSLSLWRNFFSLQEKKEMKEKRREWEKKRKTCFLPGSFFSLFILFCLLS